MLIVFVIRRRAYAAVLRLSSVCRRRRLYGMYCS